MSNEWLDLGQKSTKWKNKLFSKISVGFVSCLKCFFTMISKLKSIILFGTLRKSWPFSKIFVGFVPHQKHFFTKISRLKLIMVLGILRKSWSEDI